MPGAGTEYARLPVTETGELSSEEEDDLYTRPPRRQKARAGRPAKAGLQAVHNSFREAATRPVKRYQLLDEEDALGALQAAAPDVRVRSALSTSKKTCLALTCLLVLTGCSVAVWLVPCEWYGCHRAPPTLQQSSAHRDYEAMFADIMVTTRLAVAPAVYVDSADLVFGYKQSDSAAGGVMVVESAGAAKLWQQELYEAPVDLQCGGVDLNGNGIFECLATGGASMMALINMDKHEVEWYLHLHNSSERPVSLLPPLLLSDLTSDGVADLLVAGLLRPGPDRLDRLPRSRLMLADGATGMVLAQGPVPDCPVLLSLVAEDDLTDATVECLSSQTGVSSRTVPLSQLTKQLRTPPVPTTVRSFSSARSERGRPFQVQLDNSGVCPACRGRLTLLDGTGAAVWSTSANRSRLHSVQQFSHRNHTGVVFKLWQYAESAAGAPAAGRRSRRSWRPPAPADDEELPSLAFEESASVTQTSAGLLYSFEHPAPAEPPSATGHTRPAAAAAASDADWTPQFVTESVHVVWPAADGELRVRQLDAVQVTRFCRGDKCQPAPLPDNAVTAAVLDVGGDLDLDLVTVTSLFVPEADVVAPRYRHQCSLQTRLRKRQLFGPHWREMVPQERPAP